MGSVSRSAIEGTLQRKGTDNAASSTVVTLCQGGASSRKEAGLLLQDQVMELSLSQVCVASLCWCPIYKAPFPKLEPSALSQFMEP